MSVAGFKVGKAVAVGLSTALVVGVVSYLAVSTSGYTTTSVEAAPRAAWVTKSDRGAIALLNQQVNELETPVLPNGSDFDVLQDNASVLVFDRRTHTMQAVNTVNGVLNEAVNLPDKFDLAMSEATVAVTDTATGNLWVLPMRGLGGGDLTTQQPTATVAPGAVVTVADSTVTAVAPGTAKIVTVTNQGGHPEVTAADLPQALSASAANLPAPISITHVGAIPVVLDAAAKKLIAKGQIFQLPADAGALVLQQPGPDNHGVLVATDNALLNVDLATGSTESRSAGTTGTPSAPVRVGDCAHGAWSGTTSTYVAWCGDGAARPRQIPKVANSESLEFRANGETVVLNDSVTGDVWELDDSMTNIANWQEILAANSQDLEVGNSTVEGPSTKTTKSKQDCISDSAPTPPQAKDDKFQVQAGHPRTLRVMENDLVSNCSASVIVKVSGAGVVGEDRTAAAQTPKAAAADSPQASIVADGSAIQFTAPAGTPSTKLHYVLDDGLGHQSTAEVTVGVLAEGGRQDPKQLKDSSTAVTVGGTVTTNVVEDWDSPSGSQLFLVDAQGSVEDDKVTFSPDGAITFTDAATTGPTKKVVRYQISDGTSTVRGELAVNVEQPDNAKPLASSIYATGLIGTPITIAPLESVAWAGAEPLALAETTSMEKSSGVTITPGTDNTLTVSADAEGTYYLKYRVTAGDAEATGVIRVDVSEKASDLPTAVADVAYLPEGGEALVDLVANDVVPRGGMAAVQSMPSEFDGVQIQVNDMRTARLTARSVLPPQGVWVPYSISAGGDAVPSWLHVLPVPAPEHPPAPTALDISVSVRAGYPITLPIAQFAADPTGSVLTPKPFAAEAIDPSAGRLFTTRDAIRYLAPATGPVSKGKTIKTQYSVQNEAGKTASANLRITVVPTGNNSDPMTPPVVQSRVYAGSTVDIDLPLQRIDPDGDLVMLTSIDTPASKGTAVFGGAARLHYEAFDTPGLDQVVYTVSDPYGGTAVGVAQILVVPLPKTAEKPIAPDLTVTLAPGKNASVDVLGLASDPAGLTLSFAKDGIRVPDGKDVTVKPSGGSLIVTAGAAEGTVLVGYTVQNTRKRTADGTLKVIIDPAAPKVPPRASDVLVTKSMVDKSQKSATVDLSPVVANPGGLPGDWQAVAPDSAKKVLTVVGQRSVRVPLAKNRQVISYQVVNADKLTGEAFVIVPSYTELNIDPPSSGNAASSEDNKPQTSEPTSAAKTSENRKVAGTTKAPPSTRSSAPTSRATAPPSTPPPTTAPVEPPLQVASLQSLQVDAGTEVDIAVGDYIGGAAQGRSLQVAEGPLSVTVGEVSRTNATTLHWSVPEDATGRAQITLPVFDGVGQPVTASIPATIIPKKPDAPTLLGQTIDVEPGATADPVDLLNLVTYDPNLLGNLTFSKPTFQGADHGVTATLAGTAVTVSAPVDVPAGTTVTFTVGVTDGNSPEATATFTVKVAASTAALATVTDLTRVMLAGKADSFNVLDGATNPFPDRGPLTVLDVRKGAGYDVTFTKDGAVTITPKPDFSGEFTVPFVVGDATGDASRQVTGQIQATVKGKPSIPGTPRMLDVGNQTATIQWEESDANGAPVTGYQVRGRDGYLQECEATPCTLTDLTNNLEYTFTVVAHNEVGDSEPSNPSAKIRPDTAPEAPSTPTLQFGDGSAIATWEAPANTGSDITGYQLRISPTPDGGQPTVDVPADALTHTFEGLTNGTQYTVSVRAVNKAANPSDYSPTAAVVPAGAPGPVQNLQVSSGPDSGSAGVISVAWQSAAANGDEPHYLVHWTGDDGTDQSATVPAGTTSYEIPATNGVTYQIAVTAANKAANSQPVNAPQTVKPYTAPDPIDSLAASAPGTNGNVDLTWTAPADNGDPINTYQVHYDGSWHNLSGLGTSTTVPGLTNGKPYPFQVRACNATANCAQPSNSSNAIPFGPPLAPGSVTANADRAPGAIDLTWPAANGNGRKVTSYQWRQAGGQWVQATTTSASVTGLTNGQAYTFEVRAISDGPQNNVGAAAVSAATAPYDIPGAPTNLVAKGAENGITITFTAPATGGRPITSYEASLDNAAFITVTNGQTIQVQGFGQRSIVVRAVNPRGPSPVSNTATAAAYGPVGKVGNPRVTKKTTSRIDYAWDPPADNGINGWTYKFDTGNTSKNPVAFKNVGCGQSATLTITAIDAQGHQGPTASVTGTAAACPKPSITVGKYGNAVGHTGGSSSSKICDSPSCQFISVTFANFPPNAQVRCRWTSNSSAQAAYRWTGNIVHESDWYFGYPNRVVTIECTDPQGKVYSDSLTW